MEWLWGEFEPEAIMYSLAILVQSPSSWATRSFRAPFSSARVHRQFVSAAKQPSVDSALLWNGVSRNRGRRLAARVLSPTNDHRLALLPLRSLSYMVFCPTKPIPATYPSLCRCFASRQFSSHLVHFHHLAWFVNSHHVLCLAFGSSWWPHSWVQANEWLLSHVFGPPCTQEFIDTQDYSYGCIIRSTPYPENMLGCSDVQCTKALSPPARSLSLLHEFIEWKWITTHTFSLEVTRNHPDRWLYGWRTAWRISQSGITTSW